MTSEVEWRRSWKPTLKTSSWRLLKTEGENFHVKSVFREDSYEIMVTDFITVWHEELESQDIKKRTQKLNPSLEAPINKIVDLLREHVGDNKKGANFSSAFKQVPDGQGEKILLTMSAKLAGLPFTWKFYGEEVDKKEVAEHLTLPLLTMVSELNRRQEELFTLLKKKDKEIEDRKAQGGKVSRKHFETGCFFDTVFTSNMAASKDFTDEVRQHGQNSFTSSVQDLYLNIMMKQAYMTRERGEDEDDSMEYDGSVPQAAGSTSAGQSWNNRVPPSIINQGASVSPKKSPAKSPAKTVSSPESSPQKDTELLRRQALERRLAEEEEKKEQKAKKKKKMKF